MFRLSAYVNLPKGGTLCGGNLNDLLSMIQDDDDDDEGKKKVGG